MKLHLIILHIIQYTHQLFGSSNKPYKLSLYHLKQSYNIGDHIDFTPKLNKSAVNPITVVVTMACSGIPTITRRSYIKAKKSYGPSISISSSDYHADDNTITSCTFTATSSDSSIPVASAVVSFKLLMRTLSLHSPTTSKLSKLELGATSAVVLKVKPSSFPTFGELPITVEPPGCIRVSEHKKYPPITTLPFTKGSSSTTFDIAANLENCSESTTYTLSIETPSKYKKWLQSPPINNITIRTAPIPNVDISLSITGEKNSVIPITTDLSAKLKLSRKLTKFFDKEFPENYKISLREESNLIHFVPDSIPINMSKDSYSFKMSINSPPSTPLNIKLEASTDYNKIQIKPNYSYRSGNQKQIKTTCSSKEHVKVGTKFSVTCRVYECPKGVNKDGQLIIRANVTGGVSGSGQFEWVERSSGVINAFKSCGLTNKSKTIDLQATTVGNANISFNLDGVSKDSFITPASIAVNITSQGPLYLEVEDKSSIPGSFNYDSKPYKVKVKMNDKLKTGKLAVKVKLESTNGPIEGVSIDNGSMIFDENNKERYFILRFDKSCITSNNCTEKDYLIKFENEGGLNDGQIVVMPDELHIKVNTDRNNNNLENDEGNKDNNGKEKDHNNNKKENNKENDKGIFEQIKSFLSKFFESDRNKIIVLVIFVLIVIYMIGGKKNNIPQQNIVPVNYGYGNGYGYNQDMYY